MKTSIATVSISGDLAEKLEAIAAAGFDGVEIFENDFLTFGASARDVGHMARDLGLEITLFQPFRDFEGLPEPLRTRAFERAQKERNTGLFCTARTPERERLFQCVGPLMAVEGVFYTRRGSGQRLASLDEARGVPTILVVRSFFTHQFLQTQGFTNLHSVSRPEDMLRMLMNDRAPLMFANKLTVPEMAAQQGVALADLVPLRSVLRVDEYLAFSPRTPPQTVARWAAALAALRRDGTLGRILARWNAGD